MAYSHSDFTQSEVLCCAEKAITMTLSEGCRKTIRTMDTSICYGLCGTPIRGQGVGIDTSYTLSTQCVFSWPIGNYG